MDLLEELKYHLNITWRDEDKDLERLMADGKKYLEGIAGRPVNFERDREAKQLLFNRCRYVRNHSAEFFSGNFQSDLLRFSIDQALEDIR